MHFLIRFLWKAVKTIFIKLYFSFTGALAYAELGTMNTSSGAEWAYFMDAFGPAPAFLFSWVSTLVLKPSQMAIICLSFAQYAVEAFVSECDPPMSVVKMVALVAIGNYNRVILVVYIFVQTFPNLLTSYALFLFYCLNSHDIVC